MNELNQLKIASEIAGENSEARQLIDECLVNWLSKSKEADYDFQEDDQEEDE
jgi:hypothetical protein